MKKKTIQIIATLLLIATQATAQTGKEWDDPLTTSVNREKAHTVSIPMGSEANAGSSTG